VIAYAAAAMAATNVRTHVPLPLGELTELEGGRVRVVMPLNARTRGLVQQIVERLDAHRLRVQPAAKADGVATYSIARKSYYDLRVATRTTSSSTRAAIVASAIPRTQTSPS